MNTTNEETESSSYSNSSKAVVTVLSVYLGDDAGADIVEIHQVPSGYRTGVVCIPLQVASVLHDDVLQRRFRSSIFEQTRSLSTVMHRYGPESRQAERAESKLLHAIRAWERRWTQEYVTNREQQIR